jgi:hypothetical protein
MTTVSPDGDVMRPCVAREGKEREREIEIRPRVLLYYPRLCNPKGNNPQCQAIG